MSYTLRYRKMHQINIQLCLKFNNGGRDSAVRRGFWVKKASLVPASTNRKSNCDKTERQSIYIMCKELSDIRHRDLVNEM